MDTRRFRPIVLLLSISGALLNASICAAQTKAFMTAQGAGPYHARILLGGEGLTRDLDRQSPLTSTNAHWTLRGWIRPNPSSATSALIGGIGKPNEDGRFLALENQRLVLRIGANTALRSDRTIATNEWQFVAATFDGSIARLHVCTSAIPKWRRAQSPLPRHRPCCTSHRISPRLTRP